MGQWGEKGEEGESVSLWVCGSNLRAAEEVSPHEKQIKQIGRKVAMEEGERGPRGFSGPGSSML